MSHTAIGIAIMLVATSMTNIGAVLQKKAVDGLPAFESQSIGSSIRNILKSPLWLFGWSMATIAIILNMVALGLADISVIQPLNGFGLVVLAIFSRLILKEKLSLISGLGILLVIIGVILIGFSLPQSRVFKAPIEILDSYYHLKAFVLFAAMLGVMVFVGLLAWRQIGPVGLIFAIVAASCSVIGLTFSKGFFGLLNLIGFSQTFSLFPSYILLIFLIFFSIMAMVVQQLSFQKGRAVVVTPAFAATSVVLPLLTGYIVFSERINSISIIATVLIVIGVTILGALSSPDSSDEIEENV